VAHRFKSAEHGAACFAGEADDFIYTRINNPTVRELEQTLAILEEGAEAICTSSGMGAVNVVYFALLSKVASLCTLVKLAFHSLVKLAFHSCQRSLPALLSPRIF
jgi:O-acetylhomoserine/O-acetylserine sulfhydrylase-like pyridoxal-dependent enzyme